jgi:HAE1 family hydrophobic/amphiphilic exporter-1
VTLSDLSIRRPIFTWMIMLALLVFGALGYGRLGVDQFPTMEFPILSVTAELEGASPEGMEEDVTDVLEEQLNTIAGVRSIKSTSFQGTSIIAVEFVLGTDLDVVAQDVRDKVASVRRFLPPEMDAPVVGRFNPNDQPILWIPFETNRTAVDASEYMRRQVKPVFETIEGVAGIALFGRLDRNIRIWLDGDELRARGLSASDILAALRRENVERPGGLIESSEMEYGVKTTAEFRTVKALEGLIVARGGEAPVYLRDVGWVEDGAEDRRMIARYNGAPSVGIGIRKQSGGNAVEIVDEVKRRLAQIRTILPSGIDIDMEGSDGFVDFSQSVREAVSETEFTLIMGALLAVFTVFVFLRRVRPTLVIATAIPISLVATFGLVWLAGYTLNTMTLLGLTLAVGVVIDDAIVVLENIERHREAGEEAHRAASNGTREIAFAATAATISVAAVFLPVVFVEGMVGSFLGSFGLTVAGSVLVSLFVALTLTPMLAARIPPAKQHSHGSVYHRLEAGFAHLESGYRRTLAWTLGHRGATIGLALAAFALAFVFGRQLGFEFFPPADEGIFFAKFETPQGTALGTSLEYLQRDEAWMLAQPEVAGVFSAVGFTGPRAPARPNEGMMFGTLVPRDARTRSVQEFLAAGRQALGRIPGRTIRLFNPAEMMRGGAHSGAFEVQIRGNLPLQDLDRLSDELIAGLEQRAGFVDLDKSLKLGLPELQVFPDREKAAALGVDANTIATAIRLMIGGMDVGVFKEAGLRYDIRMRLAEASRSNPEAIGRLYVRDRDGGIAELRNLIDVQMGAAPSAITRTDRQRSVTISANLEGKTLGAASAEAREVAREILPEEATLALTGRAQDMAESVAQFGLAIGLGILVVYMVLAAQFDSLIHPLTVMLALPLAMVGALGGLLVFGQTINLFSMIGIILLFGLVTKNSILLVDYANQLRAGGMDKLTAIQTAAPIRMRPVLMTAISMIFGVLPAALGLGPGSETRVPLAIATATGMLSSTVLTLLVVPVFYLVFDDIGDAVKRSFRRAQAVPVSSTSSDWSSSSSARS